MCAQERAHPLLPLGRLTNLLDIKFVWEDGTAVMQCRDKGIWRTMTKFGIRNNMAYASQMQFEVLRRALWVQQAHPDWQFWERAAQGPKMTSYLTHGVKAKMCETTPFVNSVGTQYVASRAQLDVCTPTTLTESPSCTIAEALMVPTSAMWSTMVVHTRPFPQELLQNACPHHEVILSCKPHRPGCHQWRPLHQQVYDDIQELKPDLVLRDI